MPVDDQQPSILVGGSVGGCVWCSLVPTMKEHTMPAARNSDTAGLPETLRQHHWVGDINVGLPTEGYVGAKAMHFWTLRGFNRYFADKGDTETPGMLLIPHSVTMKPYLLGLLCMVTCLVTNQLDPDEMAEMEETSRRIELDMKLWRENRAAQKVEDHKVQMLAEAEVRRLAAVGAHCEKNHKHNTKKDAP